MCVVDALETSPVGNGAMRDVAVVSVTVSSDDVYHGWVLTVNVTVANLGEVKETFVVTVYHDGVALATRTVKDLGPGESLKLTFTWDTGKVPYCRKYVVKAVASAVPGETDLDNNTFVYGEVYVRRPCDVNGDGKVDIYDVVKAAIAFNSRKGEPRWNAFADVAPAYGVIDVFDMVTIVFYYGECP